RFYRIRLGDAVLRRGDVARVQKAGLADPVVDECRLHAGQNALDATFIDVAGEALPTAALQLHFRQAVGLHERDPRLHRTYVDAQLFLQRRPHAARYRQVSTPKAWSSASVSASGRPTIPL